MKPLWREEQTVTDRVVQQATRQVTRPAKFPRKSLHHGEIREWEKSRPSLDEIGGYSTAGPRPEESRGRWLRRRGHRVGDADDVELGDMV